MDYTDLEKTVINCFEIGFNYRNAEDEKSDNATALTVEEVVEETGLDTNTIKGVFGSLYKKGLLSDWDEPDMKGVSFIEPEGIDAYYELTT